VTLFLVALVFVTLSSAVPGRYASRSSFSPGPAGFVASNLL
jgi:hypothetical protein